MLLFMIGWIFGRRGCRDEKMKKIEEEEKKKQSSSKLYTAKSQKLY